ncbi:GNAT family N-acetyltransferase [Nitrospirillum pindoramense]|nr:GNAT family N-acetyltransferase [Nitrospirillum amazonense]
MPEPVESAFIYALAHRAPDLAHRDAGAQDQAWVETLMAQDIQAILGPLPAEMAGPLVAMQVRGRLAGHAAQFPESRLQIIEHRGEAIGYWRMAWAQGRLVDIVIDAGLRGQGHGGRLLAALAAAADAVNVALTLAVRLDNPAIRLYHRLGFQPSGSTGPLQDLRRAPLAP